MLNIYGKLKFHYDNLLTRPAPPQNTFDSIRTVYEEAFDIKIPRYDVYRSKIEVDNCPISDIVTLVGPKEKDTRKLPSGVITCHNSIVYVDIIDERFLDIGSNEEADEYIKHIYNVINEIISYDHMSMSVTKAAKNPHGMLLKMLPFYYTLHHACSIFPAYVNEELFIEILLNNKLVKSKNEAETVINQVVMNAFSDIPPIIYSLIRMHMSE